MHSSYISCILTFVQTPADFAAVLDCSLAALIKRVPEQQWQQMKQQWESTLLYALPEETFVAATRRSSFVESIKRVWNYAVYERPTPNSPLDSVLAAYSEFIRLSSMTTDKPPVLIIDDASMLMAWSGKYDRQIQQNDAREFLIAEVQRRLRVTEYTMDSNDWQHAYEVSTQHTSMQPTALMPPQLFICDYIDVYYDATVRYCCLCCCALIATCQ